MHTCKVHQLLILSRSMHVQNTPHEDAHVTHATVRDVRVMCTFNTLNLLIFDPCTFFLSNVFHASFCQNTLKRLFTSQAAVEHCMIQDMQAHGHPHMHTHTHMCTLSLLVAPCFHTPGGGSVHHAAAPLPVP
jgi:hypothetical protein